MSTPATGQAAVELHALASTVRGLLSNRSAAPNLKRRHGFRRFRSGLRSKVKVWCVEHFTRRKDAARCNLCGKEYKFFNSTSNLSKHLRTSHSDVWKDAGPDKASTKPITSWVISKGNTHSRSSSKAKAITELIVDWLSTSGRPLSIVNDPGFKGILGFLEPDYQVPSRTHVASLIKKRHQNGKQELGGLLRAAPAVALTTDAWTLAGNAVVRDLHGALHLRNMEAGELRSSNFSFPR